MRKKGTTASVWLNELELERFQTIADARGISLSTLFKQSTEQAVSQSDSEKDLRAVGADIRSDLSRLMDRLLESDALQAQERSQFLDEQRNVLGNFLIDLKASQRDAVQQAFNFGVKKANERAITPTTPDPHLHYPPTPRGS